MNSNELKALIKLLRTHGVLEYEHQGVRLKLSEDVPLPLSNYKKRKNADADANEEQQEESNRDWEELTLEERLLYSATPPQIED